MVPSDDIILTYKIFFQLLRNEELLSIKDKQVFWEKTCEYFIKEGKEKTGAMIHSKIKDIVFTDENIYKLVKLVGNDVSKITPGYFSKICGTTGLIIFLVKDAFEYAGIIVEKKTLPARLYKNCMYSFDMLQTKIQRLKSIQTQFLS